MDTSELGRRMANEEMPPLTGIAVFVIWCVINGHPDPRYATTAALAELWAKFSMEASDGVRAQVDILPRRDNFENESARMRHDYERMRDEIERMRREYISQPIMRSNKTWPSY